MSIPARVKIRQRDITDCGAACLASVSAFYHLKIPIARIRQKAGTDQKGTNILGMIEAAEYLGFDARGVKGPFEALETVPLPVIVHLVVREILYHYCVLYKIDAKSVTLMDPATGKFEKKKIQEFREQWTGVAVLISPSDRFRKGNKKTPNSIRFWQLIAPESGLISLAFIGALLYTLLGLSTSIYVQKIVDFVLVDGNTRLLNLLSVAMVCLLLFQMSFGFLKSWFSMKAGQHIDRRLILGYYKHLFRLPKRFFDTMRVGEIISRVNDAVKIRSFINEAALGLMVNLLILLFSLAVMFVYYWKLAILLLFILPVYFLLYTLSNWINKKWVRRIMEESAELEAQWVESLNAAATIKRFGVETQWNERTARKFNALLYSVFRSGTYGLALSTGVEWSNRIFTILILWAGSYFVIAREMSAGELFSFYSLIAYFTGPAASMIGANRAVQDALIAADRLFEIIDLDTEQNEDTRICLSPELLDDIQFTRVGFRYGTRKEVFRDLNLVIRKGKSTAIVGDSGCGKSTLLSLLQNLYPLQKGKITIGIFELNQMSNASLRKIVGVVPQEISLFDGTIAENIALGEFYPDLRKITEIGHRLGITEFVEQLPGGYHSRISEQGTNLSSGQRQRIAIARALYRDPEILILDEATSALDPIAESRVRETLNWFKDRDKTIILIAHRLHTIRHCDEIVVLHEGRVSEAGTHENLMNLKGRYFQMFSA
ncbi:MAG TPA: peptidase domain-containing ABC transporter [Saprospiraceae bacterium]|nr:peptidase domain-containing ABC transporter [Saprospiraceae bacterium]HNT20474.1 peptidase domain-containing ABC transporter [Saprospiraceae bacterium]